MPETGRQARVLSGFRPTGRMHAGHWFGNVGNLVHLQDAHDCFVFIADRHMLTTDYDRTETLPGRVRALVLDLLAAGSHPSRPGIVEDVAAAGAARVRLVVDDTMKAVRAAMGLG
jgi:tryptophanyl-tRNA synthetase